MEERRAQARAYLLDWRLRRLEEAVGRGNASARLSSSSPPSALRQCCCCCCCCSARSGSQGEGTSSPEDAVIVGAQLASGSNIRRVEVTSSLLNVN